jgi:hypothetical protein
LPVKDLSLKESRPAADFLDVSRTTLQRLIATAFAAVALAGCGASNNPVSNGNRMTAEARLTEIATNMQIAISSNPGSLPQLTSDYISAVQSSLDLLGSVEAKQKLQETAALVAPACGACAQSLNTAITQIG